MFLLLSQRLNIIRVAEKITQNIDENSSLTGVRHLNESEIKTTLVRLRLPPHLASARFCGASFV